MITYVTGDATRPNLHGRRGIIVHVCNDIGVWGRGFVLAISKRWSEPQVAYRALFEHTDTNPPLGLVQYVQVELDIVVANLIGQRGIKTGPGRESIPIQYGAVREGLHKIARDIGMRTIGVHMPRIGCGLGGGTWDKIEPLIIETLGARGIHTTVYDLP